MLRKNRLLGTMISVGLLTTTLLPILPLNGQPRLGETIQQTTQRERLEIKVKQKIKQIKSVTWRLKMAKIAIPGIIIGGGLLATIPFLIIGLGIFLTFFLAIKHPGTKAAETLKKGVQTIKEEWGKRGWMVSERSAERILKMVVSLVAALGVGIPTVTVSIIIGAIVSALLGFTGAATDAVKKIFGLSMTSVTRAFNNIKELEELEKDNLIVLTPKQKTAIAKLKKLQKSLITQAIIKNLHLNDLQKKIVNTAVQTHSSLVEKLTIKKKMSEKKIRKLFAKYIKARWEEKNLQKEVAELSTIKEASKLEAAKEKQLEKKKNKVKKLETQYPKLRTALKKEVEAYSDKADKILDEFTKNIMKPLKAKRVKHQQIPQPAVSF